MALEDVLQAAIDAGVQRFELVNLGGEGERAMWHWELLSGDPVRWFNLSLPADFYVEWLGFGLGAERPLGFLPLRMERCTSLRIGVHRGCERAGWQGIPEKSIERGLSHALRAYVCEFDAASCTHTECPDYQTCDMERDDWL